jgi:CTP:molybdopterin cytidylyltransferase MocA
MATLSIVVPAHNEERAIGSILDRILVQSGEIQKAIQDIKQVEVIVVNDGSTDRTAEIASAYPDVRLVTHDTNQGYGAALKTGMRAASGDLIGFLDADGTYPPEALPRMVEELVRSHADVVTGSRMTGTRSGMPWLRWVGNKLFTLLVSLVGRGRIGDSASGMRILRRSALSRLGLLPDGMNFIVAMSTQAMRENLRTVEVPIEYDERVGDSKLRVVHDGLAFTSTILRIGVLYNPVRSFALLGSIAIATGAALASPPLYAWVESGQVPDGAIYRLVTVLTLFLGGFSTAVFGILAGHTIALLRGETPRARGAVERVLLSPRLPLPLACLGLLLVVLAPAVSHRAISEYLATAHIETHWSPVLLGATSFLLGLQALLAGLLIGLLHHARQWKAGWLG